jgi:hypothetical protein
MNNSVPFFPRAALNRFEMVGGMGRSERKGQENADYG